MIMYYPIHKFLPEIEAAEARASNEEHALGCDGAGHGHSGGPVTPSWQRKRGDSGHDAAAQQYRVGGGGYEFHRNMQIDFLVDCDSKRKLCGHPHIMRIHI